MLLRIKLKLDVADRNPPYILAKLAEVILMRQRTMSGVANWFEKAAKRRNKKGDDLSETKVRTAQLKLMEQINEVLVALDVASRSVLAEKNSDGLSSDASFASELVFQAISLLLYKIKFLIMYKTKPKVLFDVLVESVWALEHINLDAWDPVSRSAAVFLFHQLIQCGTQLRRDNEKFTQNLLDSDNIERYVLLAQKRLAEMEESFGDEFDDKTEKYTTTGQKSPYHSPRDVRNEEGMKGSLQRNVDDGPPQNYLAALSTVHMLTHEAHVHKNYAKNLSYLCMELAFLHFKVSPERIRTSLGKPFISICYREGELMKQMKQEKSDNFCATEMEGILNKLYSDAGAEVDYFSLANTANDELVAKFHPSGIPLLALFMSRAKLPPPKFTSLEELNIFISEKTDEEKNFLALIDKVTAEHGCGNQHQTVLKETAYYLASYGFMLRALPPVNLSFEEDDDDGPAEDEDENAEEGEGENDGEEEEQHKAHKKNDGPVKMAYLRENEHSKWLGQLQMLSTYMSARKLECLKFHNHLVPHFEYFDLDLLRVPVHAEERLDDPNATNIIKNEEEEIVDDFADDDEEEGNNEDGSPKKPKKTIDQVQYFEDQKTKKAAIKLLKDIMQKLARASVFATAGSAGFLLQTCVSIALNALFVVSPSPAECIPAGIKGSYEDLDPDTYVGLQDPDTVKETKKKKKSADDEDEDSEEAAAAKEANRQKVKDMLKNNPKLLSQDFATFLEANTNIFEEEDGDSEKPNLLWLHLGMIANSVVNALFEMKIKSGGDPTGAPDTEDGEIDMNEVNQAEDSDVASKDEVKIVAEAEKNKSNMSNAGEEVEELWFLEGGNLLDMNNIAKFIGFTVLCFHHLQRWSVVIDLAARFNKATCGQYATTFMPFVLDAQKQTNALSVKILNNTKRYIQWSKTTFEYEQKQVPRKVLRQLTLLGQLSEPEILYNKRIFYYQNLEKRQKKLHTAWKATLDYFELSHKMVFNAVPIAIDQLKKNRLATSFQISRG